MSIYTTRTKSAVRIVIRQRALMKGKLLKYRNNNKQINKSLHMEQIYTYIFRKPYYPMHSTRIFQ